MRIIAGEFRGRPLLAPLGKQTRPITDRVKQSVFDVLAPYIPDAKVYDCFSGTGSMGLECLSRGAGEVVFFERDRSALQQLQRNIANLGVADRCRIVASDLFHYLAEPVEPPLKADLIFLDPPYHFLRDRSGQLRQLGLHLAQGHLAPRGQVIFRHDRADCLELPGLGVLDQRDYGSMSVQWLTCL